LIGRVFWTLLFVTTAVIAGFAQLDRASRYEPALAIMVPDGFRGFAHRHLAAQSLAERDAGAALDHTRALIASRPAPAEHMTMLAQAATLSGDQSVALAALSAASLRGWREPLAQQTAAEAALLSGDVDSATQRIAALIATDALPNETGVQLARLLETEEGRSAFAKALAGPGRWQVLAPSRAAEVAAPVDVADTFLKAKAEGADLPCIVLNRIAGTYRNGGFAAEADRIWPGDCPQG